MASDLNTVLSVPLYWLPKSHGQRNSSLSGRLSVVRIGGGTLGGHLLERYLGLASRLSEYLSVL